MCAPASKLWSYFYKTRGGHHNNSSKGFGMYGGWLYFETPDCALVSLDAKTGKERWYKQLAPVEQDYFCSNAPLIIGNHVMTGMGGDARDSHRAVWKRAIPKQARFSGPGIRHRRTRAMPDSIPGPISIRARTAAAVRGSLIRMTPSSI